MDGLSPESEHPQSHYTHRSSEQVNVFGGQGGKRWGRHVRDCQFAQEKIQACEMQVSYYSKVIMFGDSTSDQGYHVWG